MHEEKELVGGTYREEQVENIRTYCGHGGTQA